MAIKFSNIDRDRIIAEFTSKVFDLIIIGGGITGAGIALDAATRGMQVALVEKNDFASGTSSKSTKLIHGGLRYLKQFHFKMVAEAGRERRIVHNLAPHLVIPEKMLLPIMKGGTMGAFAISIGLKIYDLLAGVKGDDRRIMLSKKKARRAEPLLPLDQLKGAGLYAEYRTDDARLTIEVLKTAHENGVSALNYVKTTDFIYTDNRVAGIRCRDQLSDRSFVIHGHHVVNAAGPWVDELRELNQSMRGKHLHITKGIHLVIPRQKLPVKQSMYFEIPDGRMIFIIPRGQISYVGTTDTEFKGDKDALKITASDASYLLDAINATLPAVDISINDIESGWAGIRPLIAEEGKSASEISRKDEIFTSQTGLISIAGGKLTGYRLMASKVVNMVAKKLKKEKGLSFRKRRTRHFPLKGNNFRNYREVKSYIGNVAERLCALGLPVDYAPYLVHNYGNQTEEILPGVNFNKRNDMDLELLKAELDFCIKEEMVARPVDFFERRTGRMYFNISSVKKYFGEISRYFMNNYKWQHLKPERELQELEKRISDTTGF